MARRQNPVQILVLLAAAALVLAWFFFRKNQPEPVSLSRPTLNLLAEIKDPVEMRFYHSEFTNAFPQQVLGILRAYETAAAGKILLASLAVTNDQVVSQALADGMRALDVDQEDPAFLGIAMQSGDRKETLPALSADFSTALEADITRALSRLLAYRPVRVEPAAPDEADMARVKTAVPNYGELSLEQGTRILRERMSSELQKAEAGLEARRAELRGAIEQAVAAGDQTRQESLKQAITQAELEHTENLKRIMADSQKDVRALELLKARP